MKRIFALTLLLSALLLSACTNRNAGSGSTQTTGGHENSQHSEPTRDTHDRNDGTISTDPDGSIGSPSHSESEAGTSGIDIGGLEPPGSVTPSDSTGHSRVTRRR